MAAFAFSAVCSLLLASGNSLTLLFLTVIFARKLFCHGSDHDSFKELPLTVKVTKLSAVISCLLPILCTLSAIVLACYQISIGFDQNVYTNSDSVFTVIASCYFLAVILWYQCVYIFMLSRLITTFQDSAFSVSNCMAFVHVLNLAAILIYGTVTFFLGISGNLGSMPLSLLNVNFILYVCGFIHLVYEFVHRLFQLVFTQRRTMINVHETSLKESQKSILMVIRKNTLLAVIQMLVVLLKTVAWSIVLEVSNGAYWPFSVYPLSTAYFVFFDMMTVTVFVVSCLCLYLTFKVNEDTYFKLCRSFDGKCEALCEKCARRKMNALQIASTPPAAESQEQTNSAI